MTASSWASFKPCFQGSTSTSDPLDSDADDVADDDIAVSVLSADDDPYSLIRLDDCPVGRRAGGNNNKGRLIIILLSVPSPTFFWWCRRNPTPPPPRTTPSVRNAVTVGKILFVPWLLLVVVVVKI